MVTDLYLVANLIGSFLVFRREDPTQTPWLSCTKLRVLWKTQRAVQWAGWRLHRWLHRSFWQEQEAAKPDNFQHLSTGGAGEGLSEDTLPRCVCKGTAGTEDRAHRGKSAGVFDSTSRDTIYWSKIWRLRFFNVFAHQGYYKQ